MSRILFVITSLNPGGAEVSLRKLALALNQTGRYELLVVSLTDIGTVGQDLVQAGISVEALQIRSARPDPRILWRLIKLIRCFQPDLVSTWLYHADLLGGITARLAGVKTVIWGIRHADVHSAKTKRLTRAIARLCATLSGVIPTRIACCSLRAREVHQALGYRSDKFCVIPNGFDLGNFRPDEEAYTSIRRELALAIDTPLIGLIARFDPLKNHQGFIAAAALISKMQPGVHFLLAGQGIDASNLILSKWIAQAGLEQRIHLLGLRHDIARLNAALDIAVLTSWSEAFPTVVGEAMACGVSCVVTDAGDAAYIVGKTGIVVPIGDMMALADGCVNLLALPPAQRQALGEQARLRIADNFEISSVVRQYENLFAEALAVSAQE